MEISILLSPFFCFIFHQINLYSAWDRYIYFIGERRKELKKNGVRKANAFDWCELNNIWGKINKSEYDAKKWTGKVRLSPQL